MHLWFKSVVYEYSTIFSPYIKNLQYHSKLFKQFKTLFFDCHILPMEMVWGIRNPKADKSIQNAKTTILGHREKVESLFKKNTDEDILNCKKTQVLLLEKEEMRRTLQLNNSLRKGPKLSLTSNSGSLLKSEHRSSLMEGGSNSGSVEMDHLSITGDKQNQREKKMSNFGKEETADKRRYDSEDKNGVDRTENKFRVKSVHKSLNKKKTEEDVRRNTQEVEVVKDERSYQLAKQLINILHENYILSIKSNHVNIKKTKLQKILASLFNHLMEMEVNHDGILLLPLFRKLAQRISEEKIAKRKERFQVHCEVKEGYSAQEFEKEGKIANQLILTLNKEIQTLRGVLAELAEEQKKLLSMIKANQGDIAEQEKKQLEISTNMQQLERKSRILNEDYQNKSAILQNIDRQYQELTTFVATQKEKPVLTQISEQYKNIQNQMLEYAAQLHCNSAYSSFKYESHPFTEIQQFMKHEMEGVVAFIEDQQNDIGDKCQKMRYFVLDSFRKFKLKDEERTKLTDSRIECIRKYIEMIQKWMQNFKVKEHYLTILKKQFVHDQQRINQQLNALLNNQFSHLHVSERAKITEMKKYWTKVVENYQYGHLFY